MLPAYIIDDLICPECKSGKIAFVRSAYSCKKCGRKFTNNDDIPDFIVFNESVSGQSVISKKGEIEFRKKLVEQEVLNSAVHFEGMPDDIGKLLDSWIKPQLEDLKWIMDYVSLGRDAKVLELGCEYGYCSSYLHNNGYHVAGGDLSHHCLVTAPPVVNRLLGFAALPPVMSFDATNLPFRDNVFDFVFSFAFVHHFPELRQLSKEISRVLRPGGYFACSWEPMVPLELFTKLRKIKFEDPHEKAYGIHEGLYNFYQYYSGFRREFSFIVGNPWSRWERVEKPTGFKRFRGLLRSLAFTTDGFGMILRKK